jgi:hypothetical protein
MGFDVIERPKTGSIMPPPPFSVPAATPAPAPAPVSVSSSGGATAGAGGTRDAPSPGRGFDDTQFYENALARYIAVGKPGALGPGAPPFLVSGDEFHRLAQIYGGIAEGTSNVKLDTSRLDAFEAKQFSKDTMDSIALMMQTPNGRQLLELLASAKGADGSPRTTTLSGMPMARLGSPLIEAERPSLGPAADDAGGHQFDGLGTNMKVSWNSDGDPFRKIRQLDRIAPDVDLFRMLVGALHGMQGSMAAGSLPDGQRLGDDRSNMMDPIMTEDYAQIGLGPYATGPQHDLTENAYRAALRRLGTRRGDNLDDRQSSTGR